MYSPQGQNYQFEKLLSIKHFFEKSSSPLKTQLHLIKFIEYQKNAKHFDSSSSVQINYVCNL